MTGTAEDLLVWMRAQLGVTEYPPGSNHVEYWDAINMHGAQGEPWCAALYLAGLLAIGVEPVTRSVFVPTIEAAYRKAGRFFLVDQARPGDQVLYRIGNGHTGALESLHTEAHTVVAIEGNTTPGVAGPQDNGGGVYRRSRPFSVVIGVGRPDFATTQPPEPTGDTDMAEKFFIDAKGPDDEGRDSVWEVVYPTGDIKNWNAARPLRSLGEIVASHPPIVGAALDPSGDGLVLFADDARRDERGHWVRSTYKTLASP